VLFVIVIAIITPGQGTRTFSEDALCRRVVYRIKGFSALNLALLVEMPHILENQSSLLPVAGTHVLPPG
jgi:hypothetical protein